MKARGVEFMRHFLKSIAARIVRTALLVPQVPAPTYDLTVTTGLVAAFASANYLISKMNIAKNCFTQAGLLDWSMDQCSVDNGHHLEFGVFRGVTIRLMAKKFARVWGFDSFEGVNEAWRSDIHMKWFDLNGSLPTVPSNVTLVKGYFDDTLGPWAASNPGPIAFLHVDSDIYSSAKTILDALKERIVSGTTILFDEYFNYPGWEEHEHKAFMEFISDTRHRFEYIGFASSYLSVAVKIL